MAFGSVNISGTYLWDDIDGKPSSFPPESHDHDDRYYTEAQVDTLIHKHNTSTEAHQDIRLLMTKLQADLDVLELKMSTNVTKNPFSATFGSLDGLTVTGVWNADLARIEF